MNVSRRPFAGLTVLAVLLAASVTPAATITSIIDGNWTDPATWVSGILPTPSDDVVLFSDVTLDADVSVQSLSVQAGSLATNGNDLNVAGNFALTGGTFTSSGFSIVTFNGSGPQTISGSPTFETLVIANTAATPSDTDAVVTSGPVTTTRALTLNDGQFMPATGSAFAYVNLNANGILKPASGATIDLTGANGFTTLQGTGSLIANSSLFRLTGSGEQVVSGPMTFHDFEVANTAASPDDANDAQFSNSIVVSGQLTITSGQLSFFAQANDVTVGPAGILKTGSGAKIAGDLTVNSGGSAISRSNEFVSFNGSGPQLISGTVTLEGVGIANTAPTPDDANSVSTTGGFTAN